MSSSLRQTRFVPNKNLGPLHISGHLRLIILKIGLQMQFNGFSNYVRHFRRTNFHHVTYKLLRINGQNNYLL